MHTLNPIRARALRAATPMNNIIMDALISAMEEACALANEGHTIIGLDITLGRPTIQLAATPRLAAMAETGAAAYYSFGIGQDGHRRRGGQLHNRRCVVKWYEEA